MVVLLAGFGLAVGYAAWWLARNGPPGILATNLANEPGLWRLPVAVLLVFGLAAAQHARGKLSGHGLGATAIALIAADLLVTGVGYNRTAPPADVYPVTPAIAFLQQHQGEGRVMPVNERWSLDKPPPAVLPPNGLMAYDLDDVQGYDSLFPGQYMAFAAAMNHGQRPTPDENGNMVFTRGYDTPQAAEAGVRYVVSQTPLPESPTLHAASSAPDAFVYENTAALPRIQDAAGNAVAPTQSDAPTLLTFTVDAPAGAPYLARVHDQYFPGWSGWVSSPTRRDRLRIERGPDIFRTVYAPGLPAGPAVVTLRYTPASVEVGLYGLLWSIALGASLLGFAGVRRLRRRSG